MPEPRASLLDGGLNRSRNAGVSCLPLVFTNGPHDDPKNKRPFAFELSNGQMMAFAGLWDAWKNPANGSCLQTYTIITTDANELMAPVHNRMPVSLHESEYNRWLDREVTEQPPIDLLRPFPTEEMEAFEINKDVGNVRNNSAHLLDSK